MSITDLMIKYKNNNKLEALVEGDYFRVSPISELVGIYKDNLLIETKPLYYGLVIEKKVYDYYITIAFVKPGKDDEEVILEDVLFRSITELDAENIEEYQNCVEFAKNALKDILEKEYN